MQVPRFKKGEKRGVVSAYILMMTSEDQGREVEGEDGDGVVDPSSSRIVCFDEEGV